MKRRFLKIWILVCLGVLFATSCGPYTYTVSVDRRVPVAAASSMADSSPDVSKVESGWETINLLIYYFDSETWIKALEHAYNFEWQKALEIWLGEADNPDRDKAYCAAYNISVACEVLEMEDMAYLWKERVRKLSQKR